MKFWTSIILTGLAQVSSGQHFTRSEVHFDFSHVSGNSGDFYYPEIVGSGVGVLDFDNDGDLDVYFVQSGNFKGKKSKDKLFKNFLLESGELKFEEVTEKMGVDQSGYGIGVAVDDVNSDGWQDLIVLQLFENTILLNQQGQGFEVSKSFQSEKAWSASASFCDVNNDGKKDLYVANYVQWSESNHPKCFNSKSKRDFCGPGSFMGWEDEFYLNIDGQLIPQTQKYFTKMPQMPGLNVVCRDVNNDGWNDFIVANDGDKNLVWLNQEGKSFKEFGLFSGLAVNSEGRPEASMGMTIGDYDLDGDFDLFLTHLMDETNTLYANNGKGFFQDVSNRSALAQDSRAYTGWATGFLHVNNDIYPDLLILNGAVSDTYEFMDSSSLAQANQLFLNSSGGKFKEVKDKALSVAKSTRGAAFADIDNDGDTDVIVNNNNDRAELLLNQLNPDSWQGFVFKTSSSTPIIATLVKSSSGQKQRIDWMSDGSYASANDYRLILNQAQWNHFDELILSNSEKELLKFKLHEQPASNSYKQLVIEK